jgi:hypothetical protein
MIILASLDHLLQALVHDKLDNRLGYARVRRRQSFVKAADSTLAEDVPDALDEPVPVRQLALFCELGWGVK